MTKREIKETLIDDYSSSVEFFNKGDFKHFFGDARRCIELWPKLMILEILDDSNFAHDLIEGTDDLVFVRDNNEWRPKGAPQNQDPEGSFFCALLKKSIYYKYPTIWERGDKRSKRLYKYVDSDVEQLINFYSVASELAEHTGPSQLDMITQAKSLAEFYPKFIDDLKSLCPDSKKIFDSLPKFDSSSADLHLSTIETDLQRLYTETHNFCSTGGDRFIILLPEGQTHINTHLAEAFFMIPCSLICDFGTHSGDDISSTIDKRTWKSKVHPVKGKDDFIVGSSMVNWYFCRGEENVGELIAYDFKNWKVDRSKQLLDILTNVVKKNNSSHFYILNFLEEPKYGPHIFENILSIVFGDEKHAQNRCDIFSFSKNKETLKGLKAWENDSIIKHTVLSVSLEDFLEKIHSISSNNQIGGVRSLPKAKILFNQEEIVYYREAGIDVFGQFAPETSSEWDFYSGGEITWQELSSELDVKRIGYEKFKQNIFTIIQAPKQKVIVYTLKHNPGAGGTTMSRRLAYDICIRNSEIDNFTCLPVFLKSYNAKTIEYLLQLSEKKLDNEFLLIIVEGGWVADENINRLAQRLDSRQRNVIILRVFRTTNQAMQGGPNVTTLSSKLNEDDLELFINKYSHIAINKHPLFNEKEIKGGLEVVDFPLKLKDDITSIRLEEYVKAFMDDLPEDIKLFIGYVAFTTYYASRSLNQNLVKSFFDGAILSPESNTSLHKLLIQESDEDGKLTGCWRPRYQSFSLPILRQVWGKDWRMRVTQISIDFIKECEKVGTIGLWDKDLLYAIFILRRGSDFKENNDEERTKFSKLVQDVIANEQRPEEIYNYLVETYPDDAVFLGHYGRFLYEQAYSKKVKYDDDLYVKAEELIYDAIDVNPNIDDNHHMLGMLNMRKIQSAKRGLAKIKNEENFDSLAFEDMVYGWLNIAKDEFQKSIEINPASPYGYTALCQLFWACIELAKKLKESTNYDFCDKELMYVEITDLLGSSLNQLGNICQTYDERQTYMIQTVRIYNQVRAFHRQVLGDPKAAVAHYRQLYNSGDRENKLFYGKQFVTSILYARTDGLTNKNRNNIVWAMSRLSNSDREEVERVLRYQRSQNEIDSYESLFWFKLSGNEEFPLDEAINLLLEWLHQYEINGKTGGGKLKALYYLAVCYSAMAINSNSYNEDYIRNAKKYFKAAEELAEKFEKSSIYEYSYLGEEKDAHCILHPSQIDDAKIIEAVIVKVDRRKGYVKLPCGLEAYFPSNDFNSLEDEGKTYLKGKIGFRYSGLRLFQFERVTHLTYDQLADISDRLDAESGINQTATKSLRGYINSQRSGVYSTTHQMVFKIDRTRGFMADCSPKEYDYADREEVVFDLRKDDKTDTDFYYAINVRPACEEES